MGSSSLEYALRKFSPAFRTAMLVVIDMQEFFLKGQRWREQITEAVRQRIRAAVKENRIIILVEFAGKEPTLDCLLKELEGYDPKRVIRVTKTGPDGSAEILAACSAPNLAFDVLELCGIYRDLCYLSTLKNLRKLLPHRKFLVPQQATDPTHLPQVWDKLYKTGDVVPIDVSED